MVWRKAEEFEDYALASGLNDERTILKDMDFLSAGWYECDNIEHVDGCILDSSNFVVEFPNGDKQEIQNTRDHYWEYDANICETREIYSYAVKNPSYPKGYYFSAHALEKGTFFDLELILPDGTNFNDRNLIFFYIDLNGSDYLVDLGYVMPGDTVDSPTMLKNIGGSTSGRDLTFDLFEITG